MSSGYLFQTQNFIRCGRIFPSFKNGAADTTSRALEEVKTLIVGSLRPRQEKQAAAIAEITTHSQEHSGPID